MKVQEQENIDVPLFEISSFTLYELDNNSLTTIMKGRSAVRYNDRYEVAKIDYTDNSKEYISNMKANRGVYRDDIIDLKGDVFYEREDGLTFKTDEATHNKQTNITYADRDFVSYRLNDRVTGTSLKYNNVLNTAQATVVQAVFQLQESK